ncbi:GntR family transcriptional regulator [Leifsonia sp. LS1]|uniref:GntR family transcriptional regulator n=1 Tax=Leifsonia sp. LS1 TaxID=2828483 RepID=UPI001CFCBB14|nr:GntR family transcriptional regulator [Leifsonia sp. LS1]GIT82056.1 GntR family transcriptional regulator [Leifsonia sp. LS1]
MTLRRETVAEQSAELLRAQMLAGQLRPGDLVTEDAMAKEIGISRPTMREVLGALVVEGLLTRNPSTRVLHVTRVTEQEIREIYIVRRLLELAGVDAMKSQALSALAPLETATRELADAVAAGDRPGVARADIRCHLATVGLVGSPDLVDFYLRQLTKLELAMAEGMRSPAELEVAQEVHVTFLQLLREGRTQEAREQLETRLNEAEADQIAIIQGKKGRVAS